MTFQRPATAGDQAATATAPAPARSAPPSEAARIGRLEIVPAAEVWPTGAAPLVRWMRANPDVLSDLLGTRLTATDDEVPGLAAAIFAESDGPRLLAVLELGVSTETTLGSLVARLSAARAAAALWICGDPRDEHVAALSWLNRSVEGRFFMARVRAARIGVSDAAPVLDLVLRPPRASDGGTSAEPRPADDRERQRRAADSPDVRLGPPTG